MSDILVLSVGTGTPSLEQRLERLRPRRAAFLCSQDTQAKVREILSHVRVGDFQPERDVVVLSQTADEASALSSEIDQSHRVYERCRDLFNTLRQHQTGAGSGWITPVAPKPWPQRCGGSPLRTDGTHGLAPDADRSGQHPFRRCGSRSAA